MKKIIYFIAAVLLMSACCEGTPREIVTASEPQSEIRIPMTGTYTVHKCSYDGHNYILVHGAERLAIEHDPDCPCHSATTSTFSIY